MERRFARLCGWGLLSSSVLLQGQLLPSITEYPIPTALSSPQSIAAGSDGALWFTEQSGNKIGRISVDGSITEYPIAAPNTSLRGIAAGSDGALWFVEGNANRIGRIATDGTINEFNTEGSPDDITAGPDGALWFTERLGNRIARITTDGILSEYPVPTPSSHPAGITTGPDGALWFTEYGANKIGRVTTSGVMREFPVPTPNGAPYRITAGQDGALWFTEFLGDKIGRINIFGVFNEYAVPGGSSLPTGITPGPDGALWFTEGNADGIARINSGGAVSEYALPAANGAPAFITTGPDGALWFTDAGSNTVGRAVLTPSTAGTPVEITTLDLSPATSGVAYSTILAASGGTGVGYTWSLYASSLPAGFTLSPAGVLTSTGNPPTPANSYLFTVQVVDSIGNTAAQALTLVVNLPATGAAQQTPVLPGATGPAGQFIFTNVGSGLWFDPPTASAFEYTMTSPSLFTSIVNFPTGFAGPFTVSANGVSLGNFSPGQSLIFPNGGVADFTVSGIGPPVDASDPTTFPLQLAFDTPMASFIQENATPGSPITSTLPHVADGNGFDTLVLLINTGATDATYSLQFFNQSGAQVNYQLDSTQAGMAGTIHAGSQAIVRTTGSGGSTHLGWGQLTAVPSVKGMVIYQQQTSAASLQEGSAPITPPSLHFFVPFDNTGGSTTSLGFANPSPGQTASVVFTLRYEGGGTDVVPSFRLDPLQQRSLALTNIWSNTAGKRGLIEVNSNTPIGLVAFRFQGSAFTLFDTIAPAGVGSSPVTSTIAHAADGNNFKSTFVLTNSGTVAAPYTLSIMNAAGQSQTFNFGVASPLSGIIPALSGLTIDTTGLGTQTKLGWVQLSAPPAVSGIEVFRQTDPGQPEQQATIPISQTNLAHFFLPFDNAGNATSIALANPDPSTSATINVTFRYTDGTSNTGQLKLPARNYNANLLATLFPSTAEKAGVAEVTSNVPIALVEVRFNPTQAFTSLRAVGP